MVKGDELGALDIFAQAMPMLQHDAETHSIAGELYSKHNRIEEAIDAFEMVLQLLPQDRGIFPRLTHLYVQSGRHKDGEALISRFKSIMRDDDPRDGLLLSNMLMEVKRYEEAREVAENVLAKEPENREALSMLAEIHEALGNADLAREYQIKLDPTIAWIGKAAPEFSAKDLDGNPISLKDYRGKIVLLDFWAVWCGPCVGEMPNVKKVYEEYHDRDFDIIGISLDTSEEKLRSFIRDREIPWRQIFSGKGWNSPVSRMYGIRAIPAPWLIDRDGRVISTRARGSRLEQLVAEAVGEKVGSSARRIP
jgi:peroxiredoxin